MSNYYTSSTANTPSGPPRPYPFSHAGHSAASTPSSRSPSIPFQTSNVRGAGASHSPAFTPAMRDRQARGKDPYAGSGSDEYDYDDDDDYDYDDVDMHDYDTPRRGPPGTSAQGTSSSSAAGVGRLFTGRSQTARRVPRPRHDGSDSSDFDFDDYDNGHGHDFVGGISALTRFQPGSRAASGQQLPSSSPSVGAGRQRGESFESWRRREHARDVLERPELLMWYAASREDSIPGTRLHFTRILCGLEDDDIQPTKTRASRKSGGNMSAARA